MLRIISSGFTRNLKSSFLLNLRNMSVVGEKLEYAEYGDPIKVIRKDQETVPDPKENEVLIEMLASPVNPADINTIQGKYAVRPKLPSVPGNEGVGKIVKLGSGVKSKKVGDIVVPIVSGLGTWRSHALYKETDIFTVPENLGILESATLTVNPPTAYRMLKDFIELKPCDTIIQNGGNSAVGQAVIQLCKAWGINSVSVVRNRPEIQELKDFLTGLGATEVLTEEEIRTTDIFKSEKYARPKLALNCIGGKSSLEIIRHLDHGGIMVTFGGMSREPVTVPISLLIFKDISLKGFWMTRWSKENLKSAKGTEMINDLIELIQSKQLKGPAYKMVPFDNYCEALMNTMTIQGFTGRKYLLDFVNKVSKEK